jgi:transposase
MLSWPCSVRVFVATDIIDMRCGFDRLAFHVQTILNQDPLSGQIFVFFNRSRDRCKILFWDRSGYCLWYKRLEAGTFEILAPLGGSRCRSIDMTRLMMILDGIDLNTARQRRRYHTLWRDTM